VRIVRTQDDQDGERVTISVSGNGRSLTWNPRDGAKSNAGAPVSSDKNLIERVVLDSPDQFVFAQLRGATYYTIGRRVRPAEAGNSESYSGPIWDLVRVAEPQRGAASKPDNLWRIFYINDVTGLIDKILYDDGGQNVTVDLLEWANLSGEIEPTLTRWTRGGQVLMELRLTSVTYGPK
jgi:hypothetical protein